MQERIRNGALCPGEDWGWGALPTATAVGAEVHGEEGLVPNDGSLPDPRGCWWDQMLWVVSSLSVGVCKP